MDSEVVQFGLMSSLRTSNIIIDTLICLLIPFFFRFVYDAVDMQSLDDLFNRFLAFFGISPRYSTRVIEAKHFMGTYGRLFDESDRNHILQRAIAFYMYKTMNMKRKPSGRYELFEGLDEDVVSRIQDDLEIDSHQNDYNDPYKESPVDVTTLQVMTLPALKEWVEIEPGLWFYHIIDSDGGASSGSGKGNGVVKESTVTYKLRAYGAQASERIDEYVNQCFQRYQDAIVAKKLSNKTRYMYVAAPSAKSEDSDEPSSAPNFKRYVLSDDKTFANLFFSAKDSILDMLNGFAAKQGKYSIRGFPYKLGFLLHGPPGTGKTSLIKAIAQHTNRHIVNISLANVKTNQELMDYMLDLRMSIPNEDFPVKLSYDKILYVMEDIDCASDVVHARDDNSDSEEEMTPAVFGQLRKFAPHDKLNLSGLLNVLDGVVDTPGRILVMTTNHVEKLDPALIRPGRIDEQLYMGPIDAEQSKLMIAHYFSCQLSASQEERIDNAFMNGSGDVTPAEIENLCAKHRNLDVMINALDTFCKQEC